MSLWFALSWTSVLKLAGRFEPSSSVESLLIFTRASLVEKNVYHRDRNLLLDGFHALHEHKIFQRRTEISVPDYLWSSLAIHFEQMSQTFENHSAIRMTLVTNLYLRIELEHMGMLSSLAIVLPRHFIEALGSCFLLVTLIVVFLAQVSV
ncbi:hypothetical protein F511_00480 [Dorcoceras hygrometricum]|uniref:Uncharacterized protein n=1 Tax=Dorcoceras hygrometricum TaxID=472368 RepID=A0A2Z7BIA6_9LAMI|nr:hypothetical protein F511_00480 [Dorcoceras hygrometricum]